MARRGYFVEGLGGAQFALPAAVERCAGSATTSAPPSSLRDRPGAGPRRRSTLAVAGRGRCHSRRALRAIRRARSAARWARSGQARRRPRGPGRRPSRSSSSTVAAGACRCWSTSATSASTGRCRPSSRASHGQRAPARRREDRRRAGRRLLTRGPAHRLGVPPGPAVSRWPRTTCSARQPDGPILLPAVSIAGRTLTEADLSMPEGDTVHHAACRIGAVLQGHIPDEIVTPHPRSRAKAGPSASRSPRDDRPSARQAPAHPLRGQPGHPLAPAHARLVARLRRGDGHRTKRGRLARLGRAWLVIRRGSVHVVQRRGPVLELMSSGRLGLDPRLAQLGPDIVTEEPFERERIMRRLRADDPRRPSATPSSTNAPWLASATSGRSRVASSPESTRGARSERSRTRRSSRSSTVCGRGCSIGAGRTAAGYSPDIRAGRLLLSPLRPADSHRRASPGRRQPPNVLVSLLPAMMAGRRLRRC